MEAAILNILMASTKFGKANKIPNYIANCTDCFQNQPFSTEESIKYKTKLK